ncbi:IS30 family transposase, partial [Haematomicrobium sanguinis]|uniref:IS30 family transposase n=3 Tax=Haematomicrobium sanguinis TaxID=479106 RepID=UPI00047CC081
LPEKASTNAITWDQGQEMAHHAQFTIDTGCKVYFCDPHSPWQRPSNENTNGLIRDFYPKGTNFNNISDEDIANTEHLINIRPRRMHDYLSATVKLEQQIQANRVALAP